MAYGRFIVGYALTEKKKRSFIKPSLVDLARSKDIELVPISSGVPLLQQGPFHVILHKISGADWAKQLEAYKQAHPDVLIIDPPDSIKQLQNRQSMLSNVVKLDLLDCGASVGIPRQLVVTSDPASVPELVAGVGLKLPLVAKPLVADGTAKSHAMALAYDERSLATLEPPLVLQEFVNHGGILFKVYVIGEEVNVVKRLSLPDMEDGKEGDDLGVRSFSRVSSAAASLNEAGFEAVSKTAGELPPEALLRKLAEQLRQRLGLHLFNLDMIRENGAGNKYYIIDINYFPGYGKMPEYESAFVNFLLSLAAHQSAEFARRSDQGTSEQEKREGFRETSTLSGTVSPRASPGAQSEVSIGKEGHIGHSPLREPTHALPPRHEGFGTIHSRPHTMSGSAQILPDSTLVDGLNAQ
jgi:inositol-1,3,4-trisphosphate 5/6-kinase/inositol-tetrakisphosphate 1-kinase